MHLNESLLEFQVYNNQRGEDQLVNFRKEKKNQVLFYLVGLIIAEIIWIIVSFNFQQKIQVSIILFLIFVWALLWSSIGYCKYYFMSTAQYIFWIQVCFHTFMFAMAKALHNHHFILCGCTIGVLFFLIFQVSILNYLITSKLFFFLHLWYGFAYYSNMKKISYMADVNWLMMLMMDLYFLYGLFMFKQIFGKWNTFSKIGKFQAVCLLYPLSIVFVFCLAGSFPQRSFNFKWNWFTFINHTVFIYICYFIIRNRQILPFNFQRRINHLQHDDRDILYQKSDAVLIQPSDYIEDVRRQSMQGNPPLAMCTYCFGKESCFCYQNCKHTAVCLECAPHWLNNGTMKRCPLCRTQSNILFKIARKNGIKFIIKGKYRFRP